MDFASPDDERSARSVQAKESDQLLGRREHSISTDGASLEDGGHFAVRTYRIRWFVLAIFFFLSVINNAIWITFSPFAVIAQCYYGVSLAWVNAFSTSAMFTFVVGVLPIAWLVGRYGVRVTVIASCCLNAAGAWIRVAAVGPDYFPLMLFGQTLTFIPYVMQSSIPSMLSSIWFPAGERVIATSLVAIIPAQVGVLLSLLIGPFVIQSPNTEFVCNSHVSRSSPAFLDWQASINNELFYYILGQAVLSMILVPLSFFVPSVPPSPPSLSKHLETRDQEKSNISYVRSLCTIIKNHYFVMYAITYGIYIGCCASLISVYEQVLVKAGYAEYQNIIGLVGLGIQGFSILGTIMMGRWIDWSKTFFASSLTSCLMALVAAVGYSLALQFKAPFYATAILVSLTSGFSGLIGAIGYEYSAEMTYPISASVSAALLTVSTQVVGIVVVEVVGVMVEHGLAVYVNWLLTGLLVLGCLVMVFIRPKLRRVKLDSQCEENDRSGKENRKPLWTHKFGCLQND